MSEIDIYRMYIPQIAEMIADCQKMTPEGYAEWKRESREAASVAAIDFMEKIFALTDRFVTMQ